jgi:hypothetical protein
MKTAGTATRVARAAALAATAVILLVGCPYSAGTPLADPSSAPLDRSLSGVWQSEDPETHQVVTLTFVPFDAHQMVAFARENGPDSTPVSAFRLFVTPVGEEKFLNVQELGADGEPQWYFARYRLEGDTLRLRLVDDTLFGGKSFATREALQGFIRASLGDPRLFGDPADETPDMILKRVPK